MSKIRALTVTAVLGSLFALASGALASAPSPPGAGGGGGGNVSRGCEAPSVAECQRVMSGLVNPACRARNNDACKQILGDAFQAQWLADRGTSCHEQGQGQVCVPGDLAPVIMPSPMTRGGILLGAAQEPFDNASLLAGGSVSSDLTYASMRQHELLPGAFSRFELAGQHPILDSRWPAFDADGPQIHSCREYVFEKYYDYERFEDAAASCRGDYLCLAELVALSDPALPGLNKVTLLSRDGAGTAMKTQVRPQPGDPFVTNVTQKKNAFFEEPPGIFVARMRTKLPASLIAEMIPAFSAGSAADYTYSDRLTWHLDRRDAQAPYAMTLAEYRNIELRAVRYAAALDEYRIRRATVGADLNKLLDPSAFNSCGHAFLIDPFPPNDILPDPTCLGGRPGNEKWRQPYDPLAAPATRYRNTLFYKAMDAVIALLVEEWQHPSVADGITVDHGCLDPASVRCDWSPKLLTEYLHLFSKPRENDFRECVRSTSERFRTPSIPSMAGDLSVGRLDARASWVALEEWYPYAARIRGELLKGLPKSEGDLGSSKAGGDGLGDSSVFRGEYSYNIGYRVHLNRPDPTAPGSVCSMNGRFDGNAKAIVTVLGQRAYTVLDAGVLATAGEGGDPIAHISSHLTVANKEIYNEPDQRLEFHHAEPAFHKKVLDFRQTIFIGAIPVTFGAGAELDIDFATDVTLQAPQPAVCDTNNPATVDLEAAFTPSAKARGYVFGAIGGELAGFGAEAGIEGSVDLVNLKVPVKSTLHAIPDYNFGNGTTGLGLKFTSSASFELTLLSGDVKAYAEVCVIECERTERTLITFDGIKLAKVPAWTPIDKVFPVLILGDAP